MTLSHDGLRRALQDRPFRFLESVDSTQDVALAWLRDGAESGSVVIADEQRRGRGRQGRVWYTPPGVALALSVILRPTVKALPQITMLGALAIYDMLQQAGADAIAIKWPNDVRLLGRKVSGVLPEVSWQGDRLQGVALGIGVNVRADFTGTELAETAVSIEPALGKSVDRVELIATLLRRVDFWAMRLSTPELFETWKSRLETIGQYVTVGGVSGMALSVDRDGALLVRNSDDQVHRVLAGDVALGQR